MPQLVDEISDLELFDERTKCTKIKFWLTMGIDLNVSDSFIDVYL